MGIDFALTPLALFTLIVGAAFPFYLSIASRIPPTLRTRHISVRPSASPVARDRLPGRDLLPDLPAVGELHGTVGMREACLEAEEPALLRLGGAQRGAGCVKEDAL